MYFIFSIYVLIKLRFKIDKNAAINIIFCVVAFTVRPVGAILDIYSNDKAMTDYIDILNCNAEFLTQISLYLFVFEMQEVLIKIESKEFLTC